MKSRHILIVVALVLTAEGTGWADFVLTGTQHMNVTTNHTTGVLFDASTADVLAGGYISKAYVNDSALLRVMRPSDWALDKAWLYSTGRIVVSSGGVSGYLYAYENSSVAVLGGNVFGVYAYDISNVHISGGSVQVAAFQDSSVAIAGGSVNLDACGSSTVTISAGSLSPLYARETSRADVSGGSVSALYAYDTTTITLHGYDFRATGGAALVGDEVIGTGALTGKWFDGTPWVINIGEHAAGATIRTNSDPAEVLLPGDADCNRTVELADLAILAFNWDIQSGATWWMGDFDGDGDVDLADLSALAFHWGQTGANPPVPEPATMALLGLGALAMIRQGRSRKP